MLSPFWVHLLTYSKALNQPINKSKVKHVIVLRNMGEKVVLYIFFLELIMPVTEQLNQQRKKHRHLFLLMHVYLFHT